jgi:hypothetical protein
VVFGAQGLRGWGGGAAGRMHMGQGVVSRSPGGEGSSGQNPAPEVCSPHSAGNCCAIAVLEVVQVACCPRCIAHSQTQKAVPVGAKTVTQFMHSGSNTQPITQPGAMLKSMQMLPAEISHPAAAPALRSA